MDEQSGKSEEEEVMGEGGTCTEVTTGGCGFFCHSDFFRLTSGIVFTTILELQFQCSVVTSFVKVSFFFS